GAETHHRRMRLARLAQVNVAIFLELRLGHVFPGPVAAALRKHAAERGLDRLDPTSVNVFFAFGRSAPYQWRPRKLAILPSPTHRNRFRLPSCAPRSTASTRRCTAC